MKMPYATRMKEHLARYKREVLGVPEDGIYRRSRKPYPHLLPSALRWLNVISPVRDACRSYCENERPSIRLHPDLHHLNSSQAFAFNLFFPWIGAPGQRDELARALDLPGAESRTCRFEYEPMKGEGTNIDFMIQHPRSRVLVEVKLTEAAFGRCRNDDDHRRKLERIYAPRLRDHVAAGSLAPETFFTRYQLFRNVAHLDVERGDVLVLLLPRANEHAWNEALDFRAEHLLPHSRPHVRIVAAEDVAVRLALSAASSFPRLSTSVEELQQKYLLPAS